MDIHYSQEQYNEAWTTLSQNIHVYAKYVTV
jgi:hypothetical protein